MKKIFCFLLITISLEARLISISLENRNHDPKKQYSSFNLILNEEYYTSLPKNELENKAYNFIDNFIKSIIKGKVNENLIIKAYRASNKYLFENEIEDKSFVKYSIFKIKNIKETMKSVALIETKKGYYKLELYIANKNNKSLEIFNSNIIYLRIDLKDLNNDIIYYK